MNKEKTLKLMNEHHKKFIEIEDNSGKKKSYSIKCFIPMKEYKGNNIKDVEVLLNKNRNHYFSIKMFIEGKSWVKHATLSDSKDQRIKKKAALNNCSCGDLSQENYKEIYSIISNLANKISR